MKVLPKYALIVAGGRGLRMKNDIPKQFLLLGDKPVLMHTIQRFYDFDPGITIVLVLAEDNFRVWNELCKKYNFSIPVKLVKGGDTRFQSVKNGLENIPGEEGLVAIHDAVRPLVSKEIIEKAFLSAENFGSGVAAVELKESLRKIDKESNLSVDRSAFRIIQTPQCFRLGLIRKAYSQPEDSLFTDDSSVAENSGNKIYLIEGSYNNIKITTPDDLALAESILRNY